uniref:Uncharacterized protein n=1 Tax=Esox lucius TaxID=8010 RepID=A0A6Q2YI08_ESOLU
MAGEKENANRCSDVAHNIECGRLSASPNALPLTPSSDHLDSDDFTSLISMLVVRLLTKIHSKTDLHSVDIAGRSQQLIPKVMAAFCAMSGYSETQAYPEKLNICKVYRAVYKHILEETGSEKILQMAMSTQDSQFERILVKSLSKELFDCCNQATRVQAHIIMYHLVFTESHQILFVMIIV